MSIPPHNRKCYVGPISMPVRSTILWVFFVSIMVILTIGPAKAITPMKINTDRLPDDCHITHWYLLGPFALASVSDSAAIKAGEQHDYLSDYGYPEKSLDISGLKALSKSQGIYKTYKAASALLSLEGIYPETDNAEAYAVAELRSNRDREIGIEVGSQDALTLLVNGQSILASGGTASSAAHTAIAYDHYGVAQLHRGSNILIAKIDRKSDGGVFLLNFTSAAYIRSVLKNDSSDNIVRTIFLHVGDPIHLIIPLACVQPNTTVEIRDNWGKIQYSQAVPKNHLGAIKLPVLAEGYYSLTASSLCGSIGDSFYIGDPATVYNNVVTLRNTKVPTSEEYLSLDAIAQRYEVLTAPAYSHPSVWSWQMKLRMVIKDGVNAIKDPNSLQWTKEPGMHLREYISSIDGAHEPYLTCIPDSYSSPAPLVVALPPILGTGRPFLESAFLSSMNDLDGVERAANESHTLVVRYGNRGNLWDAPMADAQFFEVLSDVERNFDVDRNRIYLLGYSESGRRAYLLAEHYPSLFAGVATYGALPGAYDGDESHYRWAQYNNISSMIRNLDNIPMIIVNGDRDTEVPPYSAKTIYQEMVTGGVPASFHILRYGVHIQPNTESLMIPFLMEHTAIPSTHIDYTLPSINHDVEDWIQIEGREDRQLPMKLSANRDGENIYIQSSNINGLCVDFRRLTYTIGQAVNVVWNGNSTTIHAVAGCVSLHNGTPARYDGINTISDGTLAEALSEPFMVVIGTGSGIKDEIGGKRDAFISMWKSEFFVTPRITKDIDLTPDDIHQFNMVLIGKPASNSLLSVANVLAARVMSKVFSSPEAQRPGSMIQEAFVLPNPLNVKRSLVFLDLTTDLLNSQSFDPVFTGFYDYEFWDETGQMLKSGIFDQTEFNTLSVSLPEVEPATPVTDQSVP